MSSTNTDTGNRHERRVAAAAERKAVHPRAIKRGWRVKGWAYEAGVSVSSTWELVASGRVKSVKFGAARIITTPPEEFLASLPTT